MIPLGQTPTYGDHMMGRAEGTLHTPQPPMTKPKEPSMTLERKPLTHDEIVYTCDAMLAYGGFAAHIANAMFVADTANRNRLLEAFPDLFEKYGPGSDFYKA